MGLSLIEGLAKAFSMILVSEIGDKTFFVAALMAMRHSRRFVLAGSLAALWLMTALSAIFGWAAPNLLPKEWTHFVATGLFLFFGLRSLWDGLMQSTSRAEEEMREVEEQLKKSSPGGSTASLDSLDSPTPVEPQQGAMNSTSFSTVERRRAAAAEGGDDAAAMNGRAKERREGKLADAAPAGLSKSRRWRRGDLLSSVFLQVFSLVFLGEWGDKSQIATIGLAAEENVWGVALGGCLGHAICSGAAVWGGRRLATRISERMVSVFGGVLFLAFAAHSALHTPG